MFFKTPVRSLKFISFDIKSFFFLQSVEVQEKKAKNIKKVARKKKEVIIIKSYIFILRFSNFNLRDLGVKVEKTRVYN